MIVNGEMEKERHEIKGRSWERERGVLGKGRLRNFVKGPSVGLWGEIAVDKGK